MDIFNFGYEVECYEEIPEKIVWEMEFEEKAKSFENYLLITGYYDYEPVYTEVA